MTHGVIFDLDGTLIRQQLDFEAMRREIGLPSGAPLLEALVEMNEGDKKRAEAILHRHEEIAAHSAVTLPGVAMLLDMLDRRNIRRAVLTRNSQTSAKSALAAARLGGFDPVVAREDAPFKPQPGGILAICSTWGVSSANVIMVGDYLYDVRAGVAAGVRTVLVSHGRSLPFAAEADLVIPSFDPLPESLLAWLGGDVATTGCNVL